MSNTKHTPGPWMAYAGNISSTTAKRNRGNISDPRMHNRMVASINQVCEEAEENEANARLIAAAPDLLAACQEIIDGMVDGKNSTNKNVTMYAIQMVKSAIAKATGTNS